MTSQPTCPTDQRGRISSWLDVMCMPSVYGLRTMLIGSRRLTRLVSTLMDVSRLEAGRLKGSFRLVNLGLVTRDLAVSMLSA